MGTKKMGGGGSSSKTSPKKGSSKDEGRSLSLEGRYRVRSANLIEVDFSGGSFARASETSDKINGSNEIEKNEAFPSSKGATKTARKRARRTRRKGEEDGDNVVNQHAAEQAITDAHLSPEGVHGKNTDLAGKNVNKAAAGTKNKKTTSRPSSNESDRRKKMPVVSRDYYTKGGISYRLFAPEHVFKKGYLVETEKLLERPLMVMVNGLSRTKDHWGNFDELLAQDYNVVTFDPRGIGDSRRGADWNHCVEEIVEDISSVAQMLEIPRFHMVGFSLGGMVAMSYALTHEDAIETLTVVNSSVGGSLKPFRMTPTGIATILKSGLREGDALHHGLAKHLLSKKASTKTVENVVEQWKKVERKYGRGVLITMKQLSAAIKFRNPKNLRKLKNPTLVIAGGQDKFVSPSQSKTLHKYLPNSTFKIVEKGSHELHHDHPERLKKLMDAFITKAGKDRK